MAAQVEQIGNPLDIYQKPATTFVASFIGAPPMNLMPLRSDEIRSQLRRRQPRGSRGRHPRHPPRGFRDHRARRSAGGIALDLTVEAIERVGAETFIYGTRQHEAPGVAANPGELPPGEVIVRIPGAGRARDRRADQGGGAARKAASVQRRRPPAGIDRRRA